MKIDQAVSAYVAYKQSLGMRFATEARTLKSFGKSVGDVEGFCCSKPVLVESSI